MAMNSALPLRRRHAVAPLAIAALALALPALASAAAPAPAPWPPLPEDAWNQAARPDSGGRDAIILYEEGVAQDKGSSYRYSIVRRIRIFTEEGREAGKLEVDYLKGEQKLIQVRGRSVRKDGTATELSPDQVITTTVLKSGGTEFNRATMIVPGIEPGCIVEYEYTIEGRYGGFWALPWKFQNEYYTVESRFRWKPASLLRARPRWTMHRVPESYVERTCTPDCDQAKEIVFALRGIPGAREEDWTPPLRDSGAGLVTYYMSPSMDTIQFWSLWKGVLDQIAELFAKDARGLDAVLAEARASDPEPEQQLAFVCRWLRSNLRSTAEPSWQELQARRKEPSFWGDHRSIRDLLRKGEGSPYEINLVLATAATELGFEARVCLLRDRREGVFDSDVIGQLPTEAVTAIRKKNGRWKYYEPASRFSIPGSVPWYLRGGPGLVAGPGESLTMSIQPDEGAAGEAAWHLDLTLDAEGGLAGPVAGSLRGEQARSYRSWLWPADPARRSELLGEDLSSKALPKLKLEAPDLETPADSALRVAGTLSYPKLAVAAGPATTLPIENLAPWRLHAAFDDERRSEPIFFRYPRRETVIVDLHLGSRGKVEELPAPRTFENEIGTWSTKWTRLDDGVRLERTVDVRHAELPARRYPLVKDFFAGLAEADRELLLIQGAP
jgi:hypothetical protein